MSTGREFWRCCIIIIPLLSKHKPPHQPRRCDAVWGHNRNMPQPSGVGGWGGENRACFSKPCRCRRTDSLGSPFDTSEMQPWGSFHRKASYGPPVEVPLSWEQSLPILPETPWHSWCLPWSVHALACSSRSNTQAQAWWGSSSYPLSRHSLRLRYPRSLLAVSKSIAAKSFMSSKFLVLLWNPNQFIDNSCKVTRNLRQIVSYIEDISPMSSSFAIILRNYPIKVWKNRFFSLLLHLSFCGLLAMSRWRESKAWPIF